MRGPLPGTVYTLTRELEQMILFGLGRSREPAILNDRPDTTLSLPYPSPHLASIRE